jgi:ankyrin repeat protein
MWASKAGHIEAVQVLLQAGADTNLQDTVRVHSVRCIVDLLLQRSVCASHGDVSSCVGLFWQSGFTALMMAACEGHTAVVQTLIAGGADVNIQSGITPSRRHTPTRAA